MTQSTSMSGRRVLVTGASRGIGAACARALASAGAVVIGVSRGGAALEAAVGALPGDDHLAIAIDVADASAWEAAMAVVDASGPLHGLVHAAGVIGPIGPIGEVAPAEFRAAIGINLVGTFLALHHAVPRMRAAGGGAGVTFSGGGATGPLGRYDAYAASKAAVIRLTENVASVAAAAGVRLNAIAPGFVATAIHDATLAAGPDNAGAAYYERTQDGLRTGGVPAELAAELACFLLGPEAVGITGRLLSAQWDPWRDETFRARLRAEPDLGMLRRIDDEFFTAVTR
jgi:3-oxoacyl-[acyl-carrier protein] reductase